MDSQAATKTTMYGLICLPLPKGAATTEQQVRGEPGYWPVAEDCLEMVLKAVLAP